jgi:hypothetical protein
VFELVEECLQTLETPLTTQPKMSRNVLTKTGGVNKETTVDRPRRRPRLVNVNVNVNNSSNSNSNSNGNGNKSHRNQPDVLPPHRQRL